MSAAKAIAYYRTSSATNVGADKDSLARQKSAVTAYAKAHDIPLLPLYDLGYTSIGCEPCTQLPGDPNNARSGRWGGQKLECGIHIQAK